jgi:hypothetical protein
MSKAQIIEEIGKMLADEVQTDCVGLWAVLWEVKQRLPSLTPAEARTTVLSIVREAIEQEVIMPADVVNIRAVPWDASPREALKRIESEWLALGREPTIGEIVWFVARTRQIRGES